MNPIDAVRINFNPDQLFLLNICLAFLLFGVALDLRLDHFREILKSPKSTIIGLSSQWILLPALTISLILIVQPPVSIALGMALVAACPGGNVSNYAVHLAGANAALSVTLTSISTLGAILLTPLYFSWLSQLIPGSEAYAGTIQVDSGQMLSTILQLILVPIVLGMGLRWRFPEFTAKIRRPVGILSMTIFLGFVFVAVYANFQQIVDYLHLVFLLVLMHNFLALTGGYWFARWNKLPPADIRAISIETGIQNSGLGLILIFNFFDGLGGMAMIAAWWGIWHLISAFSIATWWRRHPQEIGQEAAL
ncbi:bile acid:sodium symporter family protein [Flavilitoribacter nigricans]|uniref:Symporter n=1 Tax=Flavilitoribacter nigricans (strain ATCC 23147 / DSM 23189 / NBRC 102662 / NCIMB 1420 / SS-2) TaxID=1122177 RepID=A0A2D0N143_FLAN2|nr:bile acid:sodium symporter family protein [Flavilitoribacter nigricans]PHN01433.1 symporter [Flavilitoribacter nigricans DSM 23189 = NBRC 102662]